MAYVRGLLAYSRQQPLQPQRISLNAVVQDVVPLLQRLLPDAVAVRVCLCADPPHIAADPAQLQHVIMNLAVNASDAMPNGGTLTIATAVCDLTPADLRDDPEQTPVHVVRLIVTDTGIGMDAETVAHAFEPFFTTKPIGKGTGLGLSSAYGIVKQSGGDIWCDSIPQVGTTFTIQFPALAHL